MMPVLRLQSWAAACVLVGLLGACGAEQKQKEPQTGPPPAAVQPQRPHPSEEETPKPPLANAIRQFRDRAAALPSQPADLEHRAYTDALRSLAAAIEALPVRDTDDGETLRASAARIRNEASRLAQSAPRALDHTDIVHRALKDAVETVQMQAGTGKTARSAQDAVEEIDPQKPLLAQRADVDRAFRRTADLLVVAGGGHSEIGDDTVGQELSRGSEREPVGLDELRRRVGSMARQPLDQSYETMGQVLNGIADHLSRRSSSRRAAKQIEELRERASTLASAPPLSMDRSEHVKAALTAAARLLSTSWADEGRGADRQGWVAAVNSSVEAVSADGLLAFQRPVIQDAFRALVDALAALELSRQCARPG